MEFGQLHPTTPTIQANATNISKENLDCGIKALGWCTGTFCQKLANVKTFIIVLSIASTLQGATETYFRISAKQAALDHDYDRTLVSWLLVTGGILQAVLALFISFWSQKYHPISWLSGSIFVLAAASSGAIIPSITHFPFEQISAEPENIPKMCSTISHSILSMNIKEEKPFALTTLIMLFVLQFGIAMASTALYAIGIVYIDDNSEAIDSPALIAVILCTKIWGSQLGAAISLGVTWTGLGWWLGWAILIPFVFIAGILLSLFPRKLIRTVVKQAAHRILEVTTNSLSGLRSFAFIDDVNLLPSLRRLITNKILMFNLMGLAFIQLAVINFFHQEPNYLQSRFYLPTDESNGLTDEWMSRFLSYLLRPPVVGLCILIAGLIISKLNPSARSMTAWNMGIGVAIAFLFLCYIPLDCSRGTIAGTYRGKLAQPFCSRECICPSIIPFTPICPENGTQTYFSPCHAGCNKQAVLNDISIYEDCTCAQNPDLLPQSGIRATDGACNVGECQLMWILFQILTVVSAGLFGTSLIGKIIISLRVVLPQDKSLALALELLVTGIITYIPGKLIYDGISYHTCDYWSQNYEKCYLQETPIHGNILNGISAGFVIIGIIFDIFVYIFVENLDCYPVAEVDPGFTGNLQTINPRTTRRYADLSTEEEEDDEDESQTDGGERPSMNPLMHFDSSPKRRVVRADVENVSYSDIERRRKQRENLENLDFRIQTPTDTTQPESSVRSTSPDVSSERSENSYIRELRTRMDDWQRRKLVNRLPSHETDL